MEAFAALADPTRRGILELLAAGERSAGEIAGHFRISRPAVSRHLRVLREAGLATAREEAQRRIVPDRAGAAGTSSTPGSRPTAACGTDGLDRLEHHLDQEEQR